MIQNLLDALLQEIYKRKKDFKRDDLKTHRQERTYKKKGKEESVLEYTFYFEDAQIGRISYDQMNSILIMENIGKLERFNLLLGGTDKPEDSRVDLIAGKKNSFFFNIFY